MLRVVVVVVRRSEGWKVCLAEKRVETRGDLNVD